MKLRSFLIICLAALISLASVSAADAAGTGSLTDTEKNSTYGFFVWLSENAATDAEREDAEIAAQIISNTITDANKSDVFNNGTIFGGSHDISYKDLLASVELGKENDATSLDNMRAAISFIKDGNACRAKESLPALNISSAMMAMAELNADYQDYYAVFDHSMVFSVLENLAFIRVGGTWEYGDIDGLPDDPYDGWYTEEKKNYDENNGGLTGHYLTLTDRQGAMLLTGFGVRSRYVTKQEDLGDGEMYDLVLHDKYYSQTFSTKSGMYSIGDGVTPEKYLEYLELYQGSEQNPDVQTPDDQQGGEQTPDVQTTDDQQGGEQTPDVQTPGNQQGSEQTTDVQTPGNQQGSEQIPDVQTPDNQQGGEQTPDVQIPDEEDEEGTPEIRLSETEFTYAYTEQKVNTGKKKKKQKQAVATIQKPKKITVTLNGKTISSKNYDVAWSNVNSSAIGEYTVTVTLKGAYSGSATATYTIKPNAVKLKKVARGKKKFTASWKKLSKKDIKYKVITGYEIRYSTDPEFTTDVKTVSAGGIKGAKKAIKKLQPNTPYYVQIRTYKTVGGKKFYSAWSTYKKVTTK